MTNVASVMLGTAAGIAERGGCVVYKANAKEIVTQSVTNEDGTTSLKATGVPGYRPLQLQDRVLGYLILSHMSEFLTYRATGSCTLGSLPSSGTCPWQ